jgi:PAP2 superfamily C-terminal
VPDIPPMSLRVALVVIGLTIWFVTQHLIKNRPTGEGTIGDGLHALTAPLFRFFTNRPRCADALLILSSFGIDSLGLFVLGWSILGPSVGPFLGMAILFSLRQICQAVCALPSPQGMIWRSPRVPTLLVTYGVANDLFFSGHTAMAVYGAIELARWGGPAWIVVGVALTIFEMATVIVLRAHYTMDVYAGAITAIVSVYAADAIAPTCDAWLVQLGRQLFGA